MDKLLFRKSCDEIINNNRQVSGIGTLSEKTVHAVLKNYYEQNKNNHEIKLKGYVADIFNDRGIIEIQTGNFNKLRKKIETFLDEYRVTIVYPIPYIKWIYWIDEVTGEISQKRKSTKKGSPYLIFPELYKIKNFLLHHNLAFRIVLINVEEYRLLNGWSKDKKKGSTRVDRFPLDIVDEVEINNLDDYIKLVPKELPDEFTSKDYKKTASISISNAQTALNVLSYVKAVNRLGKKGNSIVYSTSQGNH